MTTVELELDEYDETPPDDAIAEIAETAPELTKQERLYVYWRTLALPPGAAYKKAGYTGTNWRSVETRPKVRNALQDMNEKLEPEYRITQKKVIGILMEGIEIARRESKAKIMIEGAVALANVAGVMSATKIAIQSENRHAHRIEQQSETKALQHLPRTSLEGMVGINRVLPAPVPVEEAEFEVVS